MDKKLKQDIEALGRRTKARTAKRQLKEKGERLLAGVLEGLAPIPKGSARGQTSGRLSPEDSVAPYQPPKAYVGAALKDQPVAKRNLAARQAFVAAQAGLPVFEFTLNVQSQLLGKAIECLATRVKQQLTCELTLWAGSTGEPPQDFHLLTFTVAHEPQARELRDYLAEHGWKLGARFHVNEVKP